MDRENYLSIGEFAKHSGIARKNLIYYDSIDLLKPEIVLENGYRYYHYHQLYTAHMINALKEIKIPLKEIKAYMQVQSADRILEILTQQKRMATAKKEYFTQMEQMLDMQIQGFAQKQQFKHNKIEIIELDEINLLVNNLSHDNVQTRFTTSLNNFYEFAVTQNAFLPYPLGMIICEDGINNDTLSLKENFKMYARVPSGNDIRPKGNYISIYISGNDYEEGYTKLYNYIQANKLFPVGRLYVDFIVNELVAKNFDDFMSRMLIKIEEIIPNV